MLWAYFKITLSVTIVLSTIAYARQRRIDDDCRQIRSVTLRPVEAPRDPAQRGESLSRYRAERGYLHRLFEDMVWQETYAPSNAK